MLKNSKFEMKDKVQHMWTLIIFVLLAAFVAYVQFAPSDPNRWHKDVTGEQNADFADGAFRIVEAELTDLDRVIRESGGRVLAGSVEDGLITYISRTRIVGFPDYTTVQRRGAHLAIYGRLRFGKSDLAVNMKRIEGWISKL